jgi:hypothetical protein
MRRRKTVMFVRIRSTAAADEEEQKKKNCGQQPYCGDYAWNELPLTGVQMVVVVVVVVAFRISRSTVVSRRERWTGR